MGCTASPSGPVPYLRLKYSTFHAAGATPDEFRPCNCRPSQTMAKQSPPSPQDTGSTSTMVAAAAMAASTALPPLSSIRRPACAASGCEVDTTLRAKTGMRVDGYGLTQLKAFI
ncbi:Uncharacterised protein [Bordetella pertussis]|nr:Uncharacterised protein [Bordetella pertussis]